LTRDDIAWKSDCPIFFTQFFKDTFIGATQKADLTFQTIGKLNMQATGFKHAYVYDIPFHFFLLQEIKRRIPRATRTLKDIWGGAK
jgi:hypothetical protein